MTAVTWPHPTLATIEVRWFFPGRAREHPLLPGWFETAAPFPRREPAGAPRWSGRAGGEPDRYLLLPGRADMGIKWREGALQIKGRIAELGTVTFAGRHQGRVERWVKWSYPDLPDAYRRLFGPDGEAGTRVVAVDKVRAVRQVRADPRTGALEEVAPDGSMARGVGIELADVVVDGRPFGTVAFEALPDDPEMHGAFLRIVDAFLHSLSVDLGAAASASYPAWLGDLREGV